MSSQPPKTDVRPPKRVNGTHVTVRPTGRMRYPPSKWRWLWLALPLLLVYPIYLAGCALLGVRTVDVSADPLPLGQSGVADDAWAELLATYVINGAVDYDRLVAEPGELERYAATLGQVGPTSTPARFSSDDERLAYYINAYNALTLLGVVSQWPIDSVHDVHGPFEPKPGLGFFWGLRFRLDGDSVNLYDLENDVIRELGDARIHAAINCASASCPALAGEPYRAENLDDQLDRAAERFASEPPHMVVDEEGGQIRLSAIYDWFPEDFTRHASQLGVGDTVLDWIAHFARPDVAAELERARRAGAEVVFVPYDWTLNRYRGDS